MVRGDPDGGGRGDARASREEACGGAHRGWGVVVVLALTSRWWLPALPTLYGAIEATSELIGAFADLTTIATSVMLMIGAVLTFVDLRGFQAGSEIFSGRPLSPSSRSPSTT